GATVDANVGALARHLARRGARDRLIFCGHSRGGLECLALLARFTSLTARCDGVVLSQTPHGPSHIMDSVLLRRHRETLRGVLRHAAELAQRAGLALLGAQRGGYELTSEAWPALVARVSDLAWPFQVLQAASWS